MRRPLADTLLDLIGAADEPEELAIVRVSGLEIDVPIEVRVRRIGEDWVLLGDVPGWRWTTTFDDPPGRLKTRIQLELSCERAELRLPSPRYSGRGDGGEIPLTPTPLP